MLRLKARIWIVFILGLEIIHAKTSVESTRDKGCDVETDDLRCQCPNPLGKTLELRITLEFTRDGAEFDKQVHMI